MDADRWQDSPGESSSARQTSSGVIVHRFSHKATWNMVERMQWESTQWLQMQSSCMEKTDWVESREKQRQASIHSTQKYVPHRATGRLAAGGTWYGQPPDGDPAATTLWPSSRLSTFIMASPPDWPPPDYSHLHSWQGLRCLPKAPWQLCLWP